MKLALLLASAYLLGSIPFSYYLVRWLRGLDVRTLGSGNPGAANVLRVAGKKAAAAAFFFDAAKGAAAVALAESWSADRRWEAAAAVAVVLGHLFPLFLGFRGGKGVATGVGAVAVISPWVSVLAVLIFLVLVALTRYVAIGSVAASAMAGPLMVVAGRLGWARPPDPTELWAVVSISTLIAIRHLGNLKRLWLGQEARILDPVAKRGQTT